MSYQFMLWTISALCTTGNRVNGISKLYQIGKPIPETLDPIQKCMFRFFFFLQNTPSIFQGFPEKLNLQHSWLARQVNQICYKTLFHIIMEDENSHAMSSACQRLREACLVKRPQSLRTDGLGLSLKCEGLRTSSSRTEDCHSSSSIVAEEGRIQPSLTFAFLFYSDSQRIG